MKKLKSICMILFIIGIYSCTEKPVEETGKESVIIGKFVVISSEKDFEGNPIKNNFLRTLDSVKIFLEQNNSPIDSTFTMAGSYDFKNLDAGNYRLRAYINEMIYKTSELATTSGSDTITVSDIPISTYTTNKNKLEILSIYPNPIQGNTIVQLGIGEQANVRLYLVNLRGDIINELANDNMAADTLLLSYNLSIQPGTYFLVAESKDNFSYANITKNP